MIVVPTTTFPWIWPSNGKIIRGPFQNFWILPLMEVFRHVYMTNCCYFYFRWFVAWGFMIHYWCLDYDGWWLILPILFLISWFNWRLNFLTLNSFWWYVHCWTHLSYHLPFICLLSDSSLSTLFTLPMTLFTLQRVVIFDLSNDLVFTSLVS